MQTKKDLSASVLTIAAMFLISSPMHLLSQSGTPEMSADVVFPKDSREEIYDPNGDYKLTDNGRIRVSGHHKNRIKTGEFIYYNKSGQIEKRENYEDGLLHGESVAYNYGVPVSRREYEKGKKINYEYEFNNYDTTFIAGPYLKDGFSTGVFTMLSKKRIQISRNAYNTELIYDTLFFKANAPVTVHHYSFIKQPDRVTRVFYAVMALKTKRAAYTSEFLESLVQRMKSYGPYYIPSRQNCLTKYYDASGKLIFRSDSGYAINYFPNGRIKDSLSICEEGKVCRTLYNDKGELLSAIRTDKLYPLHTTNLYYDRNKTLIYEISAMDGKPGSMKIHSDSIKKKDPAGVLTDCYGTLYFYDPVTFAVDSSLTRLEFKYRKKERIPDGRYFVIATRGIKKKMYRAIEFKGNYYNDFNVDSTLAQPPGMGSRVEMYRHDSVIYLVENNYFYGSDSKEEKYNIRKFLLQHGKLFMAHSRVSKTAIIDKEGLLRSFEADTLPSLKTELIAEKDLKAVMEMKPIRKMSKKECIQWIKTCEAIKALNEKNTSSLIGDGDYYYKVDLNRRLYLHEFYVMGYNPYIPVKEYANWLQSLKLKQPELEKAFKLLQIE